jgi:RHS repeat-associated protein
MRRRVRREYAWAGGAWSKTNEVHYVYDGMLVIQERDANNLPQVTYTHGRDLSGSLQGAGGIGGLLARTANSELLSPNCYFCADGNGNITCLINTNQILVAKYLYDPFGNILSQSGPIADVNGYRFSSKEIHLSSGTYYYGYRFYDPTLNRWLSRDHIGELGGLNLYRTSRNDPASFVDPYGASDVPGWDALSNAAGCVCDAAETTATALWRAGKTTVNAVERAVGTAASTTWSAVGGRQVVDALSYAATAIYSVYAPHGYGVVGGLSGDLGAGGTGAGGTGSVGYGRFAAYTPSEQGGVFASGGAFVRESPGVVSLQLPDYDQTPWSLGAYAGIGAGPFFTNAKKACQLKGPFKQWNLNTPLFGANWAWSEPTWFFSITVGPPSGVASVSAYPTTTTTYPAH